MTILLIIGISLNFIGALLLSIATFKPRIDIEQDLNSAGKEDSKIAKAQDDYKKLDLSKIGMVLLCLGFLLQLAHIVLTNLNICI